MAETGFLDRVVQVDGVEYRYVVYVPRRATLPAPVLLSLHGIGERGSDGLVQTQGGLARAIRTHPDAWPGIVRQIPFWVFHGDEDEAIPVDESRKMVASLQRVGADVRYTEFPGVGHGAWDPAYAMPELAEWMFQQRR